MNTGKWILVAGAVLAALAVMSGAFGAHALQTVLTDKSRSWYDTAVTYHANHAMALLVCGVISLYPGAGPARSWLQIAASCFLAGIALFSGSLYSMALTGISKLGMITPVGGVFLILAWLSLTIAITRLEPRVGER